MAMRLPLMSETRTPAPSFQNGLEHIRTSLMEMDEGACAGAFELAAGDRALKTTISLCAECLGHVPAVVFSRGDRVLMRKRCPVHGVAEALVESDLAYYRLSNKDRWGRRYATEGAGVQDIPAYSGGCCGSGGCDQAKEAGWAEGDDFAPQMGNKSCTVLVEVTNACNLACPVCYSDARGDRRMPLDVFKE